MHKDEILKNQILSVLNMNPSYGHRRLAVALGIGKRTRRVMRKFNIKPFKRKSNRFKKRLHLRNKPAPFKNLIKNICPIKPDLIYVSDFTYIKFKSKYIFLATLMDVFTRKIIGWSISNKHNKNLVLNALLSAFENNNYQLPEIIHSDQGSEYNCKHYVNFLDFLNIRISMSKKHLLGKMVIRNPSTQTLKQS